MVAVISSYAFGAYLVREGVLTFFKNSLFGMCVCFLRGADDSIKAPFAEQFENGSHHRGVELGTGTLVVDTRDADHEAGDLLQAGIDVSALPTLADVVGQTAAWQQATRPAHGPVFFKSCGWGGWDLAAARLSFKNYLR